MSSWNRVALPITLFTLAFLAGCSSSSSPHVVPPPSGGFSNSNLNGTYVFSVSGTDTSGAPYAIVGTFTASGGSGNGTEQLGGGTLDITDADTSVFTGGPLANQTISGGTYSVGADGRGKVTLPTSTPFRTIILDFVLQDSSHGLVTELDNAASGSGTLDIQTSGVTPSGTYAFSFGGNDETSSSLAPFATVGQFTVGTGGSVSGLEDLNDGGFAYTEYTIGGSVVAGPSSTPASVLTSSFESGTQTYDVYVIDANHLKFIEMDGLATLSGDAFSSTSPAISGTLAFTLVGSYPGTDSPSAAGGFIVTDGNGDITSSSTEDGNEDGTTTPSPLTFTGTYAAAGTGRFLLSNLSGFFGGNEYAAYPFSGGVFLLEVDNSGIMSGAVYTQSPSAIGTFSTSAGYGLNLTGDNLADDVEVDDIAEFANTSTTCGTYTTNILSGITDENYAPAGKPSYANALCGTYAAPDANGRGQVGTTANTLNGGFLLNFYTVDGTTYPFIEMDSTQVSVGAFVVQNAQATGSAAAKRSHPFLIRSFVKPRAAVKKPNALKKQK